MKARRDRLAGAFVVALLMTVLAGPALAHEMRTAEIAIELVSAREAKVSLRAPPRSAIELEPPEGCRFDPAPSPLGVLRCREDLAGGSIDVHGLGDGVDVALVRLVDLGGASSSEVVTKRASRIALPGAAAGRSVASRYVRFGVEHVLSGLDHVLFLVALFWQAWTSARGVTKRVALELARTATGFTVAHSVTSTATMLGWLRVPASAAEACIAFSLVLVALDIGRTERERGPDEKRGLAPSPLSRVALASAFGLVHGLGFAGALAEARLPGEALTVALVAFNVGVEIGQAALFAACLVAVLLARRVAPLRPSRLATASAYVIGVTGATLFFLRTVSLLRG